MNKYVELKSRQQKEINDFPLFFAYSNKQFDEGMRKLGLEPNETDKIYKLGNTGGFYRKSDSQKLKDMFDRHDKEMFEAMKDDEFVLQMFEYELGNHEFYITYNYDDALRACGLKFDELDERMLGLLKTARDNYIKGCDYWC